MKFSDALGDVSEITTGPEHCSVALAWPGKVSLCTPLLQKLLWLSLVFSRDLVFPT